MQVPTTTIGIVQEDPLLEVHGDNFNQIMHGNCEELID